MYFNIYMLEFKQTIISFYFLKGQIFRYKNKNYILQINPIKIL